MFKIIKQIFTLILRVLGKPVKEQDNIHKTITKKETSPVTYTLTTSNKKMRYGEENRFQAKLKLNEAAVIGEKITFKVVGKSYEKTTDENGVASLDIRLKPGEYTIQTIFENICNENTITILQENKENKPVKTENNNFKGLFVRGVDADKLDLSELKKKGYTHIFLSHIYYLNNGSDKLSEYADKTHKAGLELIIFYTTYYNGSSMVNPLSGEADTRIKTIEKIANETNIDGVCLDYNRHNSSNHNDQIMNRITENTNKVVSDLKGKEVYATCMFESPEALSGYYHQDIGNWRVKNVLPMAYKYNYAYSDKKMLEMKKSLFARNSRILLIFQNYSGDDNVKDIGSKQLVSDVKAVNSSDGYLVFRYGTGVY